MGEGASSEPRTIYVCDCGNVVNYEMVERCPDCGTDTKPYVPAGVRVVEQQSSTEGERTEATDWPKTLYLCFECGGFDDSPLPHRHGQGLKKHSAQKLGIGVVPVDPEPPEHQPDDEAGQRAAREVLRQVDAGASWHDAQVYVLNHGARGRSQNELWEWVVDLIRVNEWSRTVAAVVEVLRSDELCRELDVKPNEHELVKDIADHIESHERFKADRQGGQGA